LEKTTLPTHTIGSQEIHRLARLGAIARLKELEDEASAIRRMFPGLKKIAEKAPRPASDTPAPRRRRRSRMSAEARLAARERMRAYWAAKKREGQAADEAGAASDAAPGEPSQNPRPAKKARKSRGTSKRGASKKR
jgi:hypothetical protein